MLHQGSRSVSLAMLAVAVGVIWICNLDEYAGLPVLQTLITDAQHALKPEYIAHRVTSIAVSTNSRHPP